jgi:hypothetical protein
MPSHMSTIGFPLANKDDFSRLGWQTERMGETVKLPDGSFYKFWSPGQGIELWAQFGEQGTPVGLNPHFKGAARMQVGLTRRIKRPRASALDGAFYGWANPREGGGPSGDYPFVFDAPDYRAYDVLNLPHMVSVQLAAFAHSLEVYENDAALDTSPGSMSAESCIPSGTFRPGGGAIEPPKSEIILYGHVLETERLINSFTSLPFYWARVRSFGGEFDVVPDPELVKGTIVKNGVVGGSFWLSGRIQ